MLLGGHSGITNIVKELQWKPAKFIPEHTIWPPGQYVDLTEGTDINSSVGETRVFSHNCNIITVQDGKGFHSPSHRQQQKRYLSKSEVAQQLAKERQARQNAEKRE